ncbi:glycosyltransferase family 4 protein [Hymenobacter arizonensis]|uniref:glycosyltransferase family 4 protein n=1 Tax=Hymenobacter arizonensis TaxID=1227077 RepID=UPI0011601AB2|nr:glycosyltransferase family 4 protein [Hymenobacter arizonensis]
MPNFSVLLLAWDDADPSVAVLGGSALPPTLPLVYQLAEQQPVLAVYPHLPANPAAEKEAPETAASSISEAPVADMAAENALATETSATIEPEAAHALTTAFASPGVRLLDRPATALADGKNPSPTTSQSRLIGLEELPAPTAPQPTDASDEPTAAPAYQRPALARSQWPTDDNNTQPWQWQAPAAPYAGASPAASSSTQAVRLPVPGMLVGQTVREAADLLLSAGLPFTAATSMPASVLPAPASPNDEDLDSAPDAELPPMLSPSAFDEPTHEPGISEAADLLAPGDDITPDVLPVASSLPAPLAPPVAEPTVSIRQPSMEGLNFRMIQYARQAAQLVQGRSDFGVIYAPNWPAWLAALEIRNSTGRPLALYVTGLVADFLSPAERGWLLEVERMTLRRAHLILVPDENVRHRLREHYGATIGEVRIVAAADEAGVQAVLSELAAK